MASLEKGVLRQRAVLGLMALTMALSLRGCRGPSPTADSGRITFLVYDAGETLGLLPVAARLRDRTTEVQWVPLTPWSAELLTENGEVFLSLPEGVDDMPHVSSREAETEIGYWEDALLRDPPRLLVSGMVSAAQGQIASRMREEQIPTRGFHDGFQPPGPASVATRTARAFDEIWVPTTRVRDGFQALGIPVILGGQPTLEAWRRTSEDVDAADIRRRLGVRADDRILLFAGQYGPGYQEVLDSFLRGMGAILARDATLRLVLSHHPRTDGSLERLALERLVPERLALDRASLAPDGVSTMELAVAAEVVLTWTSTVGVQAAFMGKPVVYFAPPADFDTHLVDQGAAFMADEVALASVLTGVLEAGDPPESIRAILMESGYVMDADSVVTELILKALGG